MTPDAQIIQEIVTSVKPELWYALAELSVIFIAIIIMKKVYQALAAYLIFKWNKELSKNVRVIWNGSKCVIMDYNWRWIHLKNLDNGHKIVLPMIKSGGYEWEIVREEDPQEKK